MIQLADIEQLRGRRDFQYRFSYAHAPRSASGTMIAEGACARMSETS
jgi:hypothetical protein